MRFLSLGIGLALSCGPAIAVETINYNNRSDTVVDVLSKSGLSTAYAVIHTAFTRRDAELQCSNYDNGDAQKKACVKLNFEGGRRLAHDVRANCLTKTFTDFFGGRYRFVGKRKNNHPGEYVVGDDAKFDIIDLKSGQEETDGPTFYSTDWTSSGPYAQGRHRRRVQGITYTPALNPHRSRRSALRRHQVHRRYRPARHVGWRSRRLRLRPYAAMLWS